MMWIGARGEGRGGLGGGGEGGLLHGEHEEQALSTGAGDLASARVAYLLPTCY